MLSNEKSEFQIFLESKRNKKVYFEPLAGNNGDTLIQIGAKHVLQKANLQLTEEVNKADLIVINGGGAMNDIWMGGLKKLEYYRREYPNIPVIVGPSSYRFENFDFNTICKISTAPLTLFARERFSEDLLRKMNMPSYVNVKVSPDLALELHDSDFIKDLITKCRSEYILIAMRKYKEGASNILIRTGRWLPGKIRRPLSKIRDWLAAMKSRDVISDIIKQENYTPNMPRVYRDVSASVSFDEFLNTICCAASIVTDRLHIGVLGYLLNKRVILRPGMYHKIRGVYELSMSGPDSRVTLWSE
jgi:exopolysaccharide biosynthesis predicted pyruvyltransferase EpsI